jgi:hypothetical protein
MNKINYFFAKLKCKNDFKKAVNNMIKIDETESNSIGEDYWKERHLQEQKNLIDKIQKLKEKFIEEANIDAQARHNNMQAKCDNTSSESEKKSIILDNSRIINTLYKDGMLPKTLLMYNYLSDLAKANKDLWVLENIVDIIILNQEEKNIEKSHQNWMFEQKNNIKKFQQELKQKQQELELREAKIIKIEASQKILNSELVEKINKEID